MHVFRRIILSLIDVAMFNSICLTSFLDRNSIICRFRFFSSQITVVEKTLNPGNWEAGWFAELDTIGTDPLNPKNATKNKAVSTRHSAVRSFEIAGK